MLEKFLPRIEFDSYEDLKKNYKVSCPDNFNFAYDIVDGWADLEPEKKALLYCDDNGTRDVYTFTDMKRLSNRCANYFMSLGIKKGDRVMFMLKQRMEVWVVFLALHKIGAVGIPATYQLTPKDIVYRANAANVRLICCVDDDEMIDYIKKSLPDCKTVNNVAVVGKKIPDGWLDLRAGIAASSDELERIPNKSTDEMLIYFSSGTTGMPKMIQGQGFGKKAAMLAVHILKTAGIQHLRLSTEAGNVKAQRLYTDIGFMKLDELDGDDLVFGLSISHDI